MKRLCVFCGSSPGARPEYVQAARALGAELASRNIALVFGGSRVGIMGQLAGSAIEAGGEVIGVITRKLLDLDIAMNGLNQLIVVETMHERKASMVELADGFIALPGGFGTMEEFFEVLTWAQLGLHPKPCGLLNVAHYFDSLVDFMDRAVVEQFIDAEHRQMIVIEDHPKALLEQFDTYLPPTNDKAAWALKMSGHRRDNHE